MSTTTKPGWHWVYEPHPSLCRHYLPVVGAHEIKNTCWCKPLLQNEPSGTIVIHN